jgi:glycosyltransferase involved in cell wall biosynthesis
LLQSLHLDCLPAGEDTTFELTPLLTIIRDHRPDLLQFGVADDGSLKIWRWWFENGRVEFFGQLDWLAKEELRSRFGRLQPRPSPANASNQSPSMGMPSRQNGDRGKSSNPLKSVSARAGKSRVGLFGYAKGEFGLGEDVRLLRAALDGANVANVVINAPWQILARQSIDEPSVEVANARFDSDVMFYVIPPFDTVTLLNKVGPHAFSARRKIGFWQWELARFPDPAKLALNLVDEIWCHSEHAANAYREVTDKPVIKVPLPVFVPETRIASRTTFGLPEEAFVIFTSFDGASAIARKNPLASILAFQQAFPKGRSSDARLIVKAMNTNDDALWRECLRRASVDERIVIIDIVMDRNVYYELLRACDAVISLHRAEGFGRLMAEAMALGIPVIASRYSGNLDFMTDDNSWLIDGDLTPVLPGDYAFHHGQVWLEPSVENAAIALRECASDRGKRQQRAALAMADIASKHSLKVCGETYSKLLGMNAIELNLLTAG